jgi:hypothetical protein
MQPYNTGVESYNSQPGTWMPGCVQEAVEEYQDTKTQCKLQVAEKKKETRVQGGEEHCGAWCSFLER